MFLWIKMLVFPALEKKNVFPIMENYNNPCQLAYGRDPAFIQVTENRIEYKLQPNRDIQFTIRSCLWGMV